MDARALRIRTPSGLGVIRGVAVGGRQARETEGFGVRGGGQGRNSKARDHRIWALS